MSLGQCQLSTWLCCCRACQCWPTPLGSEAGPTIWTQGRILHLPYFFKNNDISPIWFCGGTRVLITWLFPALGPTTSRSPTWRCHQARWLEILKKNLIIASPGGGFRFQPREGNNRLLQQKHQAPIIFSRSSSQAARKRSYMEKQLGHKDWASCFVIGRIYEFLMRAVSRKISTICKDLIWFRNISWKRTIVNMKWEYMNN